MTRKNPFLLFLSACIPGCGQMYQGYMKRGVSLMSLFALVIGLATGLYFGQLALALPVMWLYSFFDTYNLRRALENDEAEPDAYPLGLSSMDQEQFSRLLAKRHVLIGWVLVLLGLSQTWSLTEGYFTGLLSFVFGTNLHWLPGIDIPRLAVFLLMIILGVRFIRGPKRHKDDSSISPCGAAEEKASAPKNPSLSSEDPVRSRADMDGPGRDEKDFPEYRAVSAAAARILHGGEAAGAENPEGDPDSRDAHGGGAAGKEGGSSAGKEGNRHDGN